MWPWPHGGRREPCKEDEDFTQLMLGGGDWYGIRNLEANLNSIFSLKNYICLEI